MKLFRCLILLAALPLAGIAVDTVEAGNVLRAAVLLGLA